MQATYAKNGSIIIVYGTGGIDCIPVGNNQHSEIIASGIEIAPYVAPQPSVDDVRAEAQRRIIALVGATDLTSCLIKQLNANMRANELNDIQHSRELTPQEAAEAEALRGLATVIKSIRAASNVLDPNPPADYADNKYWP